MGREKVMRTFAFGPDLLSHPITDPDADKMLVYESEHHLMNCMSKTIQSVILLNQSQSTSHSAICNEISGFSITNEAFDLHHVETIGHLKPIVFQPKVLNDSSTIKNVQKNIAVAVIDFDE